MIRAGGIFIKLGIIKPQNSNFLQSQAVPTVAHVFRSVVGNWRSWIKGKCIGPATERLLFRLSSQYPENFRDISQID
jgi:hypothetical protein